MFDLTRREFIVSATVATCACTLACDGAAAAEPAGAEVDVGMAADFSADGVNDRFVKPHKFFVIRENGRLFSPSSVCTHRSCTVRPKDAGLKCPCHGSTYSRGGKVLTGPSKKSLPRFAITKRDDGRIIVNTSTRFEENQWDDPASFVELA